VKTEKGRPQMYEFRALQAADCQPYATSPVVR
jgi:hypothetical protein